MKLMVRDTEREGEREREIQKEREREIQKERGLGGGSWKKG